MRSLNILHFAFCIFAFILAGCGGTRQISEVVHDTLSVHRSDTVYIERQYVVRDSVDRRDSVIIVMHGDTVVSREVFHITERLHDREESAKERISRLDSLIRSIDRDKARVVTVEKKPGFIDKFLWCFSGLLVSAAVVIAAARFARKLM